MFNRSLLLSCILLLSFPLLFIFFSKIIPYKHSEILLPDELDDLALLHRAATLKHGRSHGGVSAVSRLGTTNARHKIAFLFLTNSDLHFAPLWEKFFNGHVDKYNVYIHADPHSNVASPGGIFNSNRFIAGKKTQRASPTLISAARRLLASSILDDPLNSYFALVSQHCIPIHSFNFVYNSLFSGPGQHESGRVNPGLVPGRRSFIEILSGEPQLWDRYVSRGEKVMLPEVPFDRFRVGSQFFVLTRNHARVVIKDRKLWRKFKLRCLNQDSCYPEEHYFPTLLSMEDPDGCSHYTLTRVNWTGSVDGHPHTYNPVEISPDLVYKLRESNNSHSHMFARKFSPDCLKPLMDIADKVIFRD